jgi:hypothetical protein
VTLDVGALYSNEIVVQPGDAIFGNMTRLSGGSAWFIDSVVQSTGKHTSIKATASQMGNNRLQNQPWAYVTLECYGERPQGSSSAVQHTWRSTTGTHLCRFVLRCRLRVLRDVPGRQFVELLP